MGVGVDVPPRLSGPPGRTGPTCPDPEWDLRINERNEQHPDPGLPDTNSTSPCSGRATSSPV